MAGSLYLAICILYMAPSSLGHQYDQEEEAKPAADGKHHESMLSFIIIVQSGCVYCKLGAIVAAGVSIVVG